VITVFFVCQPGRLELQSRILAASLRHFSKTPLHLRACVPNGFGSISEHTTDFLRKYSVEMSSFEPVTARAFDYLYGNKIDAACEKFDDGRAVFMDTDILAREEFDLQETCQERVFAVPIHQRKVFGPENAERFTDFLRTYDPRVRMTTTRAANGEAVVAAFNSGFVSFEAGSDFPQAWRRMVGDLMASELIQPREKKPYADQLALAMIYALDTQKFIIGDGRWNASAGRRGTFCHYHRLLAIFRHEHTLRALHQLDEEARSKGLRLLGEIALKDFGVKLSKNGAISEAPLLKERPA